MDMGNDAISLLVGTKKGVFKIKGCEERDQWDITGPDFYGFGINHVVQDPRNPQRLLLAGRTGHLGPSIHHSNDGGKTWVEAETPPAFPKIEAPEGEELSEEDKKKARSVKYTFWLTPSTESEPDTWYCGCSPLALFRTDDGGKTWQGVEGWNDGEWQEKIAGMGVPDVDQVVHSVNVDPRDANHLYIGVSAGGFFESTDRGATWVAMNKGMAADFIPEDDPEYGHDPHCVLYAPSNPDRLWQQNHCGMYRLDRPATEWVRVGDNMPEAIGDVGFCIQPHPHNADTAWVFPMDAADVWPRVCKGGAAAVYKTTDAGESWHRKDMGLPQHHAWLQVKRQAMCADDHEKVGVYFGTAGGEVWVSTDEGESWRAVAHHLPPILSMEVAKGI